MLALSVDRIVTRIGVVSAEPIRLAGLLSVFDAHSTIVAVDGELRELLEDASLEYMILDLSSNANWIDTLFFVRRLRPDMRQIVLGPEGQEEVILRSIVAGARAYLDSNCGPREVRHAAEVVVDGSIWAPRKILSNLIDRLLKTPATRQGFTLEKLSPRERQVLERILEARSNREIAQDLGIEERTVKAYVSSLMRKTGAENRVALSMLASQDALAELRDNANKYRE